MTKRLTITKAAADLTRPYIRNTNRPLWNRIVALERLANHRDRVARCNRQVEERRTKAIFQELRELLVELRQGLISPSAAFELMKQPQEAT